VLTGVTVQDDKGIYTLKFPHSPNTVLPNVAIADTGKLVHMVVETGSTYFTKTIAFWAQALSEAEKLAELGNCKVTPSNNIIAHRANSRVRLQCRNSLPRFQRQRIPAAPHVP
jgi:hypothetical protein